MFENTIQSTRTIIVLVLLTLLLPLVSCSDDNESSSPQKNQGVVRPIQGLDALNKILESSGGDQLLMFDLYADWCGPCRVLSPILEEIARENSDKVTVYKINVDTNPDIASGFGVTGIPFVVFVKNKIGVHAFTGVQTKETYVRAIHRFTEIDKETVILMPDGKIVDGVRMIRLSPVSSQGKIYVYRGETVQLTIDKIKMCNE